MSAAGCFVTGTDTGIGKTLVAVALLRALARRGLRVAGMKPVAAGCIETPDGLRNEDALALAAAANVPAPYAQINPYALAAPIAPHLAAAQAGVQIDPLRLTRGFAVLAARAEFVVVEGAGGWRVPLGETLDMAGLARQLALPVVLVVGLRLGCLNHALLSAEAIVASGLPLAGWVANGIDPQFECAAQNVATLDARLPAPRLGRVPFGCAAEAAAAALDVDRLLERLGR